MTKIVKVALQDFKWELLLECTVFSRFHAEGTSSFPRQLRFLKRSNKVLAEK